MRKDMWDLDVTGMKSRHALPRWDIRHRSRSGAFLRRSKGDFDVAMNEPVYCTITRATSWSNSGFIEGLD
jgi:hypothetical protein